MNKNSVACDHDHDHDEEFEFSELMEDDTYDDEVMANVMTTMVDATNHQLNRAIDLTKIIVEKSSKAMSEDEIFTVFNKAADMIADKFPVKAMWEKALEAE